MDAHQRQQFDVLLAMAVDRYADRLEQRNAGAEHALDRLRADPDGEGVWLGGYVDATFRDALLDGADGAAWVLAALARRPAPTLDAAPAAVTTVAARTVGDVAGHLARAAFAALLRDRVDEELTRRVAFGARLLASHA